MDGRPLALAVGMFASGTDGHRRLGKAWLRCSNCGEKALDMGAEHFGLPRKLGGGQ
jgi:hypothetical protein